MTLSAAKSLGKLQGYVMKLMTGGRESLADLKKLIVCMILWDWIAFAFFAISRR